MARRHFADAQRSSRCGSVLGLTAVTVSQSKGGSLVRRIKHPTKSGLPVGLPLGGITLGLVAAALVFSSPASAATSPCSDPDSLTNMPTGPVTVSAAWTQQFGRVLVIGSGPYQGCSLYLLTSDQLHSATGAPYACSDNRITTSLATPFCGRASERRRPDRRTGSQPQAAWNGDPHRSWPVRRVVGAAGDL